MAGDTTESQCRHDGAAREMEPVERAMHMQTAMMALLENWSGGHYSFPSLPKPLVSERFIQKQLLPPEDRSWSFLTVHLQQETDAKGEAYLRSPACIAHCLHANTIVSQPDYY